MLGILQELPDKIHKVVCSQNQVDLAFSYLHPNCCPPLPPPPSLHGDLLRPPACLNLVQENSFREKVDRGEH